ncbi:MAG: hypothetical protein QOF72_2029 [Blastocatellia bacterium]|jgi:hypothetical protein|nr:hypothetical protein [Blastocatellia bacterium]
MHIETRRDYCRSSSEYGARWGVERSGVEIPSFASKRNESPEANIDARAVIKNAAEPVALGLSSTGH